jgi:hypothetical protein
MAYNHTPRAADVGPSHERATSSDHVASGAVRAHHSPLKLGLVDPKAELSAGLRAGGPHGIGGRVAAPRPPRGLARA